MKFLKSPQFDTSNNSIAPLYDTKSIADSHYYERIDHGRES